MAYLDDKDNTPQALLLQQQLKEQQRHFEEMKQHIELRMEE